MALSCCICFLSPCHIFQIIICLILASSGYWGDRLYSFWIYFHCVVGWNTDFCSNIFSCQLWIYSVLGSSHASTKKMTMKTTKNNKKENEKHERKEESELQSSTRRYQSAPHNRQHWVLRSCCLWHSRKVRPPILRPLLWRQLVPTRNKRSDRKSQNAIKTHAKSRRRTSSLIAYIILQAHTI